MYQKIKKLNEIIKNIAIRLKIDMYNYTLDDVYVILSDEELIDNFNKIFNNIKSINEKSLNFCNKYQYDVIKMYFQLTERKIVKRNKIKDLKNFDNNYEIYYHDIIKYDFLSESKERNLLENYKKNKDEESKELLVGAYQQLINNIAKKWTNDDYLILDLIQAGNIGLINSIENYDLKYNVRLGTLAYRNICNMIYRTFFKYKYSNMYGYDKYKLKEKIERFIDSYIYEYSSMPTDDEIIEEFNLSFEEFNYIKNMKINYSLNESSIPEFVNDKKTLEEEMIYSIPDYYNLEDEVIEKDLEKRILEICEECLTSKELIVIKNILVLEGNDKKQEDLIGEVGTCKQYVSHLKKNAIKKLKNNEKIKKLVKEYL